jgi:hypothetical protein
MVGIRKNFYWSSIPTLLIAAQMTCDSPLLRPEIYHGNFVEYFTRIIAPLYKSHPYKPIYKTKTIRRDPSIRFSAFAPMCRQSERLNSQIRSMGIFSACILLPTNNGFSREQQILIQRTSFEKRISPWSDENYRICTFEHFAPESKMINSRTHMIYLYPAPSRGHQTLSAYQNENRHFIKHDWYANDVQNAIRIARYIPLLIPKIRHTPRNAIDSSHDGPRAHKVLVSSLVSIISIDPINLSTR